jgi:hypothetical protein
LEEKQGIIAKIYSFLPSSSWVGSGNLHALFLRRHDSQTNTASAPNSRAVMIPATIGKMLTCFGGISASWNIGEKLEPTVFVQP